jgi:hypothetical protein
MGATRTKLAEAGFEKNVARIVENEKRETKREKRRERNAGESKEKITHRSQTILSFQLSKNVGEPMLERFWAAWKSQKRIDSQRYQAPSTPGTAASR